MSRLVIIYMAKIGVRKGNIRKISVSISEDSANWLETQVEEQNYRSVSHAVDSVIRDVIKTNKTKATS
jgi:Arc/MetJ-type ribon-helix-helix transcriptional regulator